MMPGSDETNDQGLLAFLQSLGINPQGQAGPLGYAGGLGGGVPTGPPVPVWRGTPAPVTPENTPGAGLGEITPPPVPPTPPPPVVPQNPPPQPDTSAGSVPVPMPTPNPLRPSPTPAPVAPQATGTTPQATEPTGQPTAPPAQPGGQVAPAQPNQPGIGSGLTQALSGLAGIKAAPPQHIQSPPPPRPHPIAPSAALQNHMNAIIGQVMKNAQTVRTLGQALRGHQYA